MQPKPIVQILDNDFFLTFVELPKFTKSPSQFTSVEDQWHYFLKHANESNNIDDVLAQHTEIKEAYSVLGHYHWTEKEF